MKYPAAKLSGYPAASRNSWAVSKVLKACGGVIQWYQVITPKTRTSEVILEVWKEEFVYIYMYIYIVIENLEMFETTQNDVTDCFAQCGDQ